MTKDNMLSGVYFCKGFAQLKPLGDPMQVTTCFVTDGKISHLNGVQVSEFSNHVVWSLGLKHEATVWPELLLVEVTDQLAIVELLGWRTVVETRDLTEVGQ